jgi:hypothetical protein
MIEVNAERRLWQKNDAKIKLKSNLDEAMLLLENDPDNTNLIECNRLLNLATRPNASPKNRMDALDFLLEQKTYLNQY